MIVFTCENGTRYGFDFETDAAAMRITEAGNVRFSPHEGVQATLEFPSPVIQVERAA